VRMRIGIVLGHGGVALGALLPLFRLGLGGRVGSGKQWMSWIHRDDLMRLFALALREPQLEGAINGVSPQPVTNRDFTAALAAAVRRPALLPVPAAVLRLALGERATLVLAS